MDWQLIISAVLGSSIATVILNAIIISGRDRKTAKRSNEFWANILASKFENYAVRIYEEMRASDKYFDYGGHNGGNVKVPEFQPLELDKDYEFLTGPIRDAALGFQDRIIIEKVNLNKATGELNDMYPINEEIWAYIRTLGCEALETAIEVRKMAGLSSRAIAVEGTDLYDILKPKEGV